MPIPDLRSESMERALSDLQVFFASLPIASKAIIDSAKKGDRRPGKFEYEVSELMKGWTRLGPPLLEIASHTAADLSRPDLRESISSKLPALAADLKSWVADPLPLKADQVDNVVLLFIGISTLIRAIAANYTARPGSNRDESSRRAELSERVAREIEDAGRSLQAAVHLGRIESHTRTAADGAKIIADLAGNQADAKLGLHFADVAKWEQKNARVFRWLTIATFLAGVIFAAWTVSTVIDSHTHDLSAQVMRLVSTLPGFGLALYLARESAQHRQVARRAKECQVRLATLDAFIFSMTDTERSELRLSVGNSILGNPGVVAGDALSSDSKEFADVLQKLQELISEIKK